MERSFLCEFEDFDLKKRLAVSALFKVVGLCFVFDDGHFRRAGNCGYLGGYFGAGDKRHADGRVRAVVHQKYVVKDNLVADIESSVAVLAERTLYLLYLQRQALSNHVL